MPRYTFALYKHNSRLHPEEETLYERFAPEVKDFRRVVR